MHRFWIPRRDHRLAFELTYSELGAATNVLDLVRGTGSEMSLCGLHCDAIPAELERKADLRLAVLERIDAATAVIGQMIMEINKDVFVADPSGDLSRAPSLFLPVPSPVCVLFGKHGCPRIGRSLAPAPMHHCDLHCPRSMERLTDHTRSAGQCSGSQRSAMKLTRNKCQVLTVSGAGALRSCRAESSCLDQVHPQVMHPKVALIWRHTQANEGTNKQTSELANRRTEHTAPDPSSAP